MAVTSEAGEVSDAGIDGLRVGGVEGLAGDRTAERLGSAGLAESLR